MHRAIIIVIALIVDKLFGDPPNKFHPVAWMGWLIADLQKNAPKEGKWEQFRYGGYIISTGASIMVGIGWIIEQVIKILSIPSKWLIGGTALKLMLALRGLSKAGESIQKAISAGDISEARRLVSWHLVSRDTSQLDESQLAAATIESIAENTSDGVIGPLFYYAIWGLPGVIVYRFANTADAMLGYRDEKREWLGKIPARFDDILNIIPARLTTFLFLMSGKITGRNTERAIGIWQRDQHLTDSPNAGHPMSMAAGLLDVKLEKEGQYTLGAGNRSPQADDIEKMIELSRIATYLAATLFVLNSLIRRIAK